MIFLSYSGLITDTKRGSMRKQWSCYTRSYGAWHRIFTEQPFAMMYNVNGRGLACNSCDYYIISVSIITKLEISLSVYKVYNWYRYTNEEMINITHISIILYALLMALIWWCCHATKLSYITQQSLLVSNAATCNYM